MQPKDHDGFCATWMEEGGREEKERTGAQPTGIRLGERLVLAFAGPSLLDSASPHR